MLQWCEDDIPKMLRSEYYKECVTHRELKEKVYYDIIKYFDNGKVSTINANIDDGIDDFYCNCKIYASNVISATLRFF